MSEPMDFSDFTAEDSDPLDEFLDMREPDEDVAAPSYDTPDLALADKRKRPVGAIKYEKKVRGILQTGFKLTVTNPATVTDAASILMEGPKIATTLGDLAASNDRVARAVDFLTEGNESPVAAACLAVTPLLLQLIRNHEPVLEPAMRGWKIPFTKRRINLRFGIKLGRIRALTNDPGELYSHVYNNPRISAALRKQDIVPAKPANRRGRQSQSDS